MSCRLCRTILPSSRATTMAYGPKQRLAASRGPKRPVREANRQPASVRFQVRERRSAWRKSKPWKRLSDKPRQATKRRHAAVRAHHNGERRATMGAVTNKQEGIESETERKGERRRGKVPAPPQQGAHRSRVPPVQLATQGPEKKDASGKARKGPGRRRHACKAPLP